MMQRVAVIAVLLAAALESANVRGIVVKPNLADCADVVVYIEDVPGASFAPPKDPVSLDQRGLRFVPHVLAVVARTTVAFPNSDEVRHNVFSPSAARRFNLGTYPRGVTRAIRFDQLGVVNLLCNVHPEMSAFVIVLQNPYFAVTKADGNFVLPNLPPGKYTLKTWDERSQPVTREIATLGEDVQVRLVLK